MNWQETERLAEYIREDGAEVVEVLAIPTGCATRCMYPVKWLYRLLQRSSFSLARDRSYLCLIEVGVRRRMLARHIPDE